MLENIVIGAVVVVLLIAYVITSSTARKTALLLAKASTEVLELVEDVKVAHRELAELRAELEREKILSKTLLDKKQQATRRKHDRRQAPDGERTDRRDPNNRGRRHDD